MSDEADDAVARQFANADAPESRVHRRGEVGPRVDERPVEVEDEVPVGGLRRAQTANDEPQPQVRCAFGFTNLKPAPCRPST